MCVCVCVCVCVFVCVCVYPDLMSANGAVLIFFSTVSQPELGTCGIFG